VLRYLFVWYDLKKRKGVLNLLDLSEGTPFNKPFKTVSGFRDMC